MEKLEPFDDIGEYYILGFIRLILGTLQIELEVHVAIFLIDTIV